MGYPLDKISNDFARSDEFQQRYGSVDNRRFLELVYHNVLGRNPDQGGYDYWLDQDAGDVVVGRLRRRRSLARRGPATSDAWLDVNEEAPADVVEHDEVDISGVNATTAPVTAAVAKVKSRQFRAAMSVTTPTAAPPFRQRPQ